MDTIAVLIPCYNEAAAIGKVVTDFQRVLPEARIYVYDNNSTDGSGAIAKELGGPPGTSAGEGKRHQKNVFRDRRGMLYYGGRG